MDSLQPNWIKYICSLLLKNLEQITLMAGPKNTRSNVNNHYSYFNGTQVTFLPCLKQSQCCTCKLVKKFQLKSRVIYNFLAKLQLLLKFAKLQCQIYHAIKVTINIYFSTELNKVFQKKIIDSIYNSFYPFTLKIFLGKSFKSVHFAQGLSIVHLQDLL